MKIYINSTPAGSDLVYEMKYILEREYGTAAIFKTIMDHGTYYYVFGIYV